MSYPRKAALIRLARGLAYAAAAAAITFAIGALPELGEVVPAPEYSVPILMAALLAADKWIRAKRAAEAPESP